MSFALKEVFRSEELEPRTFSEPAPFNASGRNYDPFGETLPAMAMSMRLDM